MIQDNTKDSIATLQIGSKTVNRIGLGTNRLHTNNASYSLLKRALELGVNFIDTAHRYAGGESEKAIGNALYPYPDNLVIATKGGMGNGASPTQLKIELEESLNRLQLKHIDLYQLHRVDPRVPLTVSLTALKEFVDQGIIGQVGLSEVTVQQIEEAQKIIKITSVQNEYNVINRQHEDVVNHCHDHKIIFIPWFPIGGLAGDREKVEERLKSMAEKYEVSPQQIALAWILKRSPMMLPIPGTTSISHLEDNLKAQSLKLNNEDYQAILNY